MNGQGKQISAKAARKAYLPAFFVVFLILSHTSGVLAIGGDSTDHTFYGIDEEPVSDWGYTGVQSNALYANLKTEKQVFLATSLSHYGLWIEVGAPFAALNSSSFLEPAWFSGLIVLLSLFLIGGVYFLKIRGLRERNRVLEKKVREQAWELKNLKKSQGEVIEHAHKAGMADIASTVLHNVGNVLNSVNTSSSLIREKVKQSKVVNLIQANTVLREHIDDIEQFVTDNPKGKKLMEYYLSLEEPMKIERDELLTHIDRLTEKINLINEVIAAQQNYSGVNRQMETASLSEIIENALSIQGGSIDRHSLTVKKNLNATGRVTVHRSKLIHVLVNIIKNAKESMENNHPDNKRLGIETWQNGDRVFLSVTDNGVGIEREHLKKIFSHAFTTKKEGHGFGLHSCANYMKEMGGKIEVSSDGKGEGAVFTLILPAHTAVATE